MNNIISKVAASVLLAGIVILGGQIRRDILLMDIHGYSKMYFSLLGEI